MLSSRKTMTSSRRQTRFSETTLFENPIFVPVLVNPRTLWSTTHIYSNLNLEFSFLKTHFNRISGSNIFENPFLGAISGFWEPESQLSWISSFRKSKRQLKPFSSFSMTRNPQQIESGILEDPKHYSKFPKTIISKRIRSSSPERKAGESQIQYHRLIFTVWSSNL